MAEKQVNVVFVVTPHLRVRQTETNCFLSDIARQSAEVFKHFSDLYVCGALLGPSVSFPSRSASFARLHGTAHYIIFKGLVVFLKDAQLSSLRASFRDVYQFKWFSIEDIATVEGSAKLMNRSHRRFAMGVNWHS